jgi:hypothetical protein
MFVCIQLYVYAICVSRLTHINILGCMFVGCKYAHLWTYIHRKWLTEVESSDQTSMRIFEWTALFFLAMLLKFASDR